MTDRQNDDGDGLFNNKDNRHIIRTVVRFLVAMVAAVFLEWCVDKIAGTGSFKIVAMIFLFLAYTIVICDAIYLFIAIIISFCRSVNKLLLSVGINAIPILIRLAGIRFNIERNFLVIVIFLVATAVVALLLYLQ